MITQRARSPRRGFLAGASVAAALLTAIGHANAPAGRYTTSILNNVAVVLDTRTQLTWQQTPSDMTAVTWLQAQNACATLGAGWRLPSVEELETIVDETIPPPGPTIDSTFTALAVCYWTLTPLPTPSMPPFTTAWCVDFLDGRQHSDGPTMNLVRCVR
jgi:hypothetical protein